MHLYGYRHTPCKLHHSPLPPSVITPSCSCSEYSAFIGDLAQSVTDTELLQLFQGHYPSAFEARVVSDATTGHPKGFGFVRFSDEGQRDRAIQEMHGSLLHGRALRVSIAAKRSATGAASEHSAFSQGVSEVRCPPAAHGFQRTREAPRVCNVWAHPMCAAWVRDSGSGW
jgi:RNA recognition motif-containing protein